LTPIHLLAGWLVGINLSTFAYYGYDKARSRRGSGRVPEVVLHGLALAGGSPAAYVGMRWFRHKTVKGRFRIAFWAIVLLQTAVAAWVAYLVWRHPAG